VLTDRFKPILTTMCLLIFSTGGALSQSGTGDAKKGAALFKQCKTCHQVGADARNGIGPHLDGIVGRTAGTLEGFRYSSALKRKGKAGLIWDDAALATYLANPQKMVPGTRMSFRGMTKVGDRADMVAYLSTATKTAPASDANAAVVPGPEIGAAAMAIPGDAAYGEYLSTECVTCHQLTGRMEGIPSIVGWPKVNFIRALFDYKSNVRDHQVMRLVTSNLGNEEIAALAAYFSSLSPQ